MPSNNDRYSSLLSALLFFSIGLFLVLVIGYIFRSLYSQSSFQESERISIKTPKANSGIDRVQKSQEEIAPFPSTKARASSIPNLSQLDDNVRCDANSLESSDENLDLLYYQPKITSAFAHPTNYGERVFKDISGEKLKNQFLVVLHETVISSSETIKRFRTPHPNDEDQSSYHALIDLEGTIIIIVSWQNRAFGAGNSAFKYRSSFETVQTNPKIPPSVNNFAYHVSLETPPDGNDNKNSHSGYTESQYLSLAWLLTHSNVLEDRITTHKNVDLSKTRTDPRSFELNRLLSLIEIFKSLYTQEGIVC